MVGKVPFRSTLDQGRHRGNSLVKLFVEGGGDSNQLRTACREAITKFVTAAGISKRPRIVACGSRNDAFDSFRTEIERGNPAMLLVDSEMAMIPESQIGDESESWNPWVHLKKRKGDEWEMPQNAENVHCHLMVECMENWFLADIDSLKKFFGQGFVEGSLPNVSQGIEGISKSTVYQSLKLASRKSKKGEYGKGEHSFKLLGQIDPQKVITASPWAERFVCQLKKAMGC